MNSLPTCVFILAHPDDEFFILPFISEFRHSGTLVKLLFLTDGAAYGVDGARRISETRRVVAGWGIAACDVVSVGLERGIPDQALARHAVDCITAIYDLVRDANVTSVVTHAWEGGHPDHDAAHLIAVRIAEALGISDCLYEFSAYNLWRRRWPFIRCMSLIDHHKHEKNLELVKQQGLLVCFKWALSVVGYRSQWRTFLQLLPFCLSQMFLRRTVPIRLVPSGRDYGKPPHSGLTISELRFKVPFSQFQADCPVVCKSPVAGSV